MDIATVVFGEELAFLSLQARSLARFLDPDAVGRVLVIVNDVREDDCIAAVEAFRPRYGPFAGRLEVIRPDELTSGRKLGALARAQLCYVRHGRGPLMRRLPRRQRLASGWRGNPGWSMQQAQKLLAVNAVSAPYVLILDAKNFFVAPAGLDAFVAADGRARSRRVRLDDLQRRWVAASFAKLGLAAPDIAEAPPTVTPVALERGLMREGVDALEARLGALESFFSLWKGRATEFMLLFAAIDRGLGQWWERFADGLPEAATVFNKGDDAAVRETISRVGSRAGAVASPLMGLHRRAMRRIDDETGAALARFWLDLGLFESVEDARSVLAAARS